MNHFIKITSCLLLISSVSFAQKKPLDHSVYDSWESVKRVRITDNGKYGTYLVDPQEGDGTFYINKLAKNKTNSLPRIGKYDITPNEKFFIGLMQPKFSETKAHKESKKKSEDAPKDTLLVAALPFQRVDTIGGVKSYAVGTKGNRFYAYQPVDTTKTKSKKDSIWFKEPLVIREFGSTWTDTINYVNSYSFSKDGNRLVASVVPNKKDTLQKEKQVVFFDLANKKRQIISSGYYKYQSMKFDEEGTQLALLASKDSVIPTDRRFELRYFKLGQDSCQTLIGTDYSGSLPSNWFFNENSNVDFSYNGDKIFTSIAPLTLPADTVTIKEETAVLDLWHYQDPITQPGQLVNLSRDLKYTYDAVVNLNAPNKLISLTTERYESIDAVNRGDMNYAIATNTAKHIIESQWKGSPRKDIYKIDFTTGKRELLLEEWNGYIQTSPCGQFMLLYSLDDLNWHTFNIETKEQKNLTADLDVVFWDESSDTPGEPYPYGIATWQEDDQAVYIYDAFDIWKFDLNGNKAPITLTKGEGRKNNTRYRYLKTDSEKRFLESKDEILISAFDKTNKDAGIGTLRIDRPATPKLFCPMLPTQYNLVVKAKDKDDYLYVKSNFTDSPDVYFAKNNWTKSKQLSHINPQKEEYNWGTAELFKWHAFDGEPLEGIVYKPEDFDPNKKYPVMVYFYETHSDDLNSHYMPQPSWSIINISFYVSRGYVVFTPDIHYYTGMPGEGAYNCIISGTEALAKNKWIDKENMAIQGQSWGGYQVAYLVTRTNMFKAAGSGAPVSNMTSAYGGIRWGTGTSRQVQYERGQSRIGGTLWDCPELYILNSPLFRADKIETPLLIMHNDDDGAVPWYQGIELYMAMRRLQKPVWMLQYNKEAHNLIKRVNRKDLTIRLQQFFDHYLKGEPAPEWMIKGLPAVRKGKTWATDLME